MYTQIRNKYAPLLAMIVMMTLPLVSLAQLCDAGVTCTTNATSKTCMRVRSNLYQPSAINTVAMTNATCSAIGMVNPATTTLYTITFVAMATLTAPSPNRCLWSIPPFAPTCEISNADGLPVELLEFSVGANGAREYDSRLPSVNANP